MKQTVNFTSFVDAFRNYGRLSTPTNSGNFTYDALHALFEYLEQYEEDVGEELELDVIALCCDFAEYDSAREAAEEYGWEADTDQDDDENEIDALGWLQEQTTVIEFDGGVIIQSF